jgi:DNA-3-methyladenine glycosylase
MSVGNEPPDTFGRSAKKRVEILPMATAKNPAPARQPAVIQTSPRMLGRDFYARPVLAVARECIGKVLVHRTAQGEAAGRIVEAEAYRGPQDLAAHSARGLTRRTAAMFGPPGYAYVFRLYGSSWAMNLVTAEEGAPHAVLIRALEPLRGADLMAQRRRQPPHARELTNGPGKLTQALAITGEDYGRDLCGDVLYLEASELPAGRIGRSPRINVDYAGPWAAKPWRFFERGNRYVSVAPRD